MLDGGETVEIAWGELRWEGARQHAGLRGFDTEKSFAQNKTLLLCKTSSVCKSLCRAEKMNFAVNAPIIFIFQKGAGKRRKGNKPIITRICLLSFCFWVLRPPLFAVPIFRIFWLHMGQHAANIGQHSHKMGPRCPQDRPTYANIGQHIATRWANIVGPLAGCRA